MLRLSTRLDYALVFLLELAVLPAGQILSLNEFARARHLSANYLHQIVLPLRTAGLIASQEGVSGGYRLDKPADQITLLQIVQVMEGCMDLMRCLSVSQKDCPSSPLCSVGQIWRDVQAELGDILQRKTLATLSAQCRKQHLSTSQTA